MYAEGKATQVAGDIDNEVRRRRWKFIGQVLKQEPNKNCPTALVLAPEGTKESGEAKNNMLMDGRVRTRESQSRTEIMERVEVLAVA